MSNLRIQTGGLKGKKVPAVTLNEKQGKGSISNFTPALIKKSVFSIIGSSFEETGITATESLFVDCFGGSGQMGFEAASNGFGAVDILELDPSRFKAIKTFAEDVQKKSSCLIRLHRKDAFRFLPDTGDFKLLVCFMDPPYSFWKEKGREKIAQTVQNLKDLQGYHELLILIQSPEETVPGLKDFTSRNFGNHYLHIFKSW